MVWFFVLKIRRRPRPPLDPVLTSQKNWQFFLTCGSKQAGTYVPDRHWYHRHTGNESQYERDV